MNIFDTDANNEIDDQHAIALLLLSDDVFNTLGITTNTTYNGGKIELQSLEAKRVTRLVGKGDMPVYDGADGAFEDILPNLKEKEFDAVTALSGSGPAFFAYMEEAMAEGGRALGLKPAVARLLAEQTMLGTAAYLRQSGADLGEFIAGVATKGGTTAAGMDVLAASDFKKIVAKTLKAAADRSAELGR